MHWEEALAALFALLIYASITAALAGLSWVVSGLMLGGG